MLRILLAVILFSAASPNNAGQLCTYNTYSWNTVAKKSVDHALVSKDYAELTASEVDAYTGCSVCEQDQLTIRIAPLKPFKVCRKIAARLVPVVQRLIDQDEPLLEITGYRVGRTRGETDAAGNRTEFSNHSFGIALDINPEWNGLYDNCVEFGASCRLIRGGPWNPQQNTSLGADSEIVVAIESIGLKWGGEIPGRQKDFMHFSPSGY